ncbi:hypothetical protein D3C72_1451720 [compost metagenome]
MMVPPGFSTPRRSASSTIDSAMRSLIEAPGLLRSDLIQTSCPPPNRRLMRICGVLPIVCRMFWTFIVFSVAGAARLGPGGNRRRWIEMNDDFSAKHPPAPSRMMVPAVHPACRLRAFRLAAPPLSRPALPRHCPALPLLRCLTIPCCPRS